MGDRDAHQASFHVPQLLYFFAFTTLFAWPYTLHPNIIKSFFRFLMNSRTRYLLLLMCVIIALVLNTMSTAHPYLLADNRHYTFYVWRRLMLIRSPVALLFYSIFYIYCTFAVISALKPHDNLSKCLFFLSCSISLIPQSLLEFRYFVIPFLIWRLNVRTVSWKQYLLEMASNVVINFATIYLFVRHTFRWESEEGFQRFMW